MDRKDWILLKTISEEHNLTNTAKRLYISQPALTHRLNNLEKDLGIKILNRSHSGVFFTPQGEYLLEYASEMLERWDAVKDHVRHMENTVRGTVRLGVSSVIAKFKLAPLLKSFSQKFPDIEVTLTTGSSTYQLPTLLEENSIDIALLRTDISWPEQIHIIDEEPMCILSSQPIEPEGLQQKTWIRYAASALAKSHEEQDEWWQKTFGSRFPEILKVDSIEACIQLVSHGLGWCIVPKIHLRHHRSFYSTPVIWPNGQVMLRQTLMLYRFATSANPACRALSGHILREY